MHAVRRCGLLLQIYSVVCVSLCLLVTTLGQLSLASLRGRLIEYQLRLG